MDEAGFQENEALVATVQTIIVVIEVMVSFVATETWIDANKVGGIIRHPLALVSGYLRIHAKRTGSVGRKICRDPVVEQPVVRYEWRTRAVVGRNDAFGGDALFDPRGDGFELVHRKVVGGRPATAVGHVRNHEQPRKVGGFPVHLVIHVTVPARNGGSGEDAVVHRR